MNNATEFTTNNVKSGNVSLTKKYTQRNLREIILRLTAEEDFLAWVDPDLNLHFEPIGFTDSGRSFVEGDSFLIDYYFDDLSSQDYNVFEVHATGVWARYETTGAVEQQGNERVKRIIDTTITTQAEAERVAREAALKSLPIQTGRLMIQADYSLSIGDVISLTLSGTNFVVSDKKYIITEIIENPFSKIQELLITENISEAADYLYSIYETSKNPETSDLDTDATKTYTIAFDINVDVWCDYLIETHNGSVWSTHDSGKATVLNRAMAILTACLGNITRSALINVEEGDFSAGLKFQLGTGTNKPNITDQTLESKISGSDKSSTIPATRTLTDIPNIKTTVTWDTTLVNGNSITEAGYYVDRTGGRGTDYLYGTVAIFSPYNDDTDLLVKCVFPAFSKDNTNQIRVTFTWYLESSSKSRINKA